MTKVSGSDLLADAWREYQAYLKAQAAVEAYEKQVIASMGGNKQAALVELRNKNYAFELLAGSRDGHRWGFMAHALMALVVYQAAPASGARGTAYVQEGE